MYRASKERRAKGGPFDQFNHLVELGFGRGHGSSRDIPVKLGDTTLQRLLEVSRGRSDKRCTDSQMSADAHIVRLQERVALASAKIAGRRWMRRRQTSHGLFVPSLHFVETGRVSIPRAKRQSPKDRAQVRAQMWTVFVPVSHIISSFFDAQWRQRPFAVWLQPRARPCSRGVLPLGRPLRTAPPHRRTPGARHPGRSDSLRNA